MARPKFVKPTSMLITGGSSGIGKAIAMEAVRQGINVFLIARNSTKLDAAVAGFKGVFGYTAYSGSKFAVTGFSESLKAEMERYNIGVTLVCPPDTQTPMLDNEKTNKPEETKILAASATVLEPDEVARAVWSGLRRSKFWITPGRDASLLRYANRFAPSVVDWIIRRTIRKGQK